MAHALDIYRRLLGVQFRSQLTYRLSFLADAAATALSSLLMFGSLAFVLQRFGGIAGWSLWEVAFLYGLVDTSFALMDMLYSGFDPPVFGRLIRLGRLDQLMLRPVNLLAQVLGSEFALRRLGRIFQGLAIFLIALTQVQVHWTLAKVLYLPVVAASLVLFFGSLFMIGATITFWTVESVEVMNILTYGGNEMISYPMSIYPDWLRRFFTYIIPALFLSYAPALYFLEKPDPLHLPVFTAFLAPAAAIFMQGVAFLFWNYGLRHYQSTGT